MPLQKGKTELCVAPDLYYIRYVEYNMPMLNDQLFFEALSDETRRRLLLLIMKEDELCVCELFFALDMLQPKISRHLAVMREAGILATRKEGTWVFYRLHPQLPLWAVKVLEMTDQGIEHGKIYHQDAKRLGVMENRPSKCCR